MTNDETAAGTVCILRHSSEILKGNPPGDPHVRDVIVYLPPGYDDGDAHYPTVYCLTGFAGRGRMLLNDSAFAPNLAGRMDKLIAAGTIKPKGSSRSNRSNRSSPLLHPRPRRGAGKVADGTERSG